MKHVKLFEEFIQTSESLDESFKERFKAFGDSVTTWLANKAVDKMAKNYATKAVTYSRQANQLNSAATNATFSEAKSIYSEASNYMMFLSNSYFEIAKGINAGNVKKQETLTDIIEKRNAVLKKSLANHDEKLNALDQKVVDLEIYVEDNPKASDADSKAEESERLGNNLNQYYKAFKALTNVSKITY